MNKLLMLVVCALFISAILGYFDVIEFGKKKQVHSLSL